MPSVLAYFRPRTLDEASALLAEPNRRAIGGGTIVVPESRIQRDQGVELVDLQGLSLGNITLSGTTVQLGAMVRLGEMATDTRLPSLVRELARRELPSALRNQATIGGTIAMADSESVLLAGLLAYGAIVHFHAGDQVELQQLLSEGVGQRLITAVSFDSDGAAAWAATGRTPMDTPIVAAIATRRDGKTKVVLTGVALTPVLVDANDPTAGLNPPVDFRGSSPYRLQLATVLTRRALQGIDK